MKYLFFILSLLLYAPLAKAQNFHPAQIPPEKVLDAILTLMKDDNESFDRVIKGDYRDVLTDALVKDIAQKEAAEVQENCGGVYRENDLCGLGYHPILCGQDNVEYHYRTQTQTLTEAIITSKTEGSNDALYYHLVFIKDHWKLNGVKCARSATFNWHSGK